MQHTLSFTPFGDSELETHPTFNVVIAYEDFETGKQAKRTYDFLCQNLAREYRLTNQMWKFDVLNIPKLRDIAASDAAGADIVIVACRGDDLPDAVRAWLESWLPRADNALALVGLFASRELARSRGARNYLADVAQRGKMQFFANAQERDEDHHRPEESFAGGFPELNVRAFTSLAGAVRLDVSSPRWGINE